MSYKTQADAVNVWKDHSCGTFAWHVSKKMQYAGGDNGTG